MRPEGWENPYPDEPREHMRGGVHTAFEAGADAMLEGLKKQGRYWGSIVERPTFATTEKGWLVFIPEE